MLTAEKFCVFFFIIVNEEGLPPPFSFYKLFNTIA